MTGRIVSTPTVVHHCKPGWSSRVPEKLPLGLPEGTVLAIPPSPVPDGTVWECECGATWIAEEHPSRRVSFPRYRREGRFERWCRQRREAS